MPFETSVVTYAWNCWASETSRKSATNALTNVPVVPSGFVTTRSFAVPAARRGLVADREVLDATLTFVAAEPPRPTVAPFAKSVPVTVKEVPPDGGPDGR
jgi:hypothetical protein